MVNEVEWLQAINRLKSADPPLYLCPSSDLSQAARLSSQYLFSSLHSFYPKSPLDNLLVDGFDAEQIWQQIELQSKPLLSNLRRELKRFEKNPEEILRSFGDNAQSVKQSSMKLEGQGQGDLSGENRQEDSDNVEKMGFEEKKEFTDDEEEEEEVEEEEDEEDGEEEDDDDHDDGNDDEEEEEKELEEEKGEGVEDKFLKIKHLQEYIEEEEAREFGSEKHHETNEDDEDEDEELVDDGDEEVDLRYEDFFGDKKKKTSKKLKSLEDSEDQDTDEDNETKSFSVKDGKEALSTHKKQLAKVQAKVEQMEKASLEPKKWTMQGEITAARRAKNSALEVDLDFKHNVRPAPVITEEVTASLEELIKKRILEGHFDDVQKASALPSKTSKEQKELDENKSKKGLAEIYEEEYVQKTGLASAPLSFPDEQKKEATLLFKKLCLKLDALSHFHFTPKPVIEEMSVQANVPALAMEEVAPLAISDAAMLAPEEVFLGKGDFKEEAELTQAERKRRRANRKRKFKAEATKRMVKTAQEKTILKQANGSTDS